jgi:hypothetical protein
MTAILAAAAALVIIALAIEACRAWQRHDARRFARQLARAMHPAGEDFELWAAELAAAGREEGP